MTTNEIDKLLADHQPMGDGPLSLISWSFCSCGAYEAFIADDGDVSVGPAEYPCKTARKLLEMRAGATP